MIDWEKKIIAYLNGDLSKIETLELRNKIEKSSQLTSILSAHKAIEFDLKNSIEETPSNKLSEGFYSHIEGIQKTNNGSNAISKVLSIKPLLKYAAVIIIIIAVATALQKHLFVENETQQYAINEIMSDMETKSDTEKIKTLYANNAATKDNQFKIKQVLIESLKNDKSSNVRLASVETLTQFIEDDLVRSALIRSLGIEEDPQVQVAIIMALSESKNTEVIKPLEEIINKEGGYKFVKDEAHIGIMNVTSI